LKNDIDPGILGGKHRPDAADKKTFIRKEWCMSETLNAQQKQPRHGISGVGGNIEEKNPHGMKNTGPEGWNLESLLKRRSKKMVDHVMGWKKIWGRVGTYLGNRRSSADAKKTNG